MSDMKKILVLVIILIVAAFLVKAMNVLIDGPRDCAEKELIYCQEI